MPSYVTRKLSDPKEQAAREVEVSRLGTSEALNPKMATLRKLVPFDFYALSGIAYRGLGIGGGVMLASDMPEGFLREFLDRGLYAVDPMASRVTVDHNWYSWHDLSTQEKASAELRPILDLEIRYGITTRSCIGFFRKDFRYGGAIFTRATPFTETEKFILEAGARMVHQELSAARIESMANHAGLTAGETRCLQAVADGLSAEEASTFTGYTDETIASYIKAATKKLGCSNRTHAVAEALRRRLFL